MGDDFQATPPTPHDVSIDYPPEPGEELRMLYACHLRRIDDERSDYRVVQVITHVAAVHRHPHPSMRLLVRCTPRAQA